ncbi:ribonuclease E/G [Pseudaminobacter arsenicus]|uniref:Ribonuclease E n=1 Tax=Borborobacter arsenicus TaxID=1851146 RepID=A0A432V8Y3_9HYPH|nr:ribonuclease E/G [Pseudaminobacter arsenicus]RUM98642.1 ribonuclease E/G [Pseudaminobacter arsenicus]
MPNKMLIDASHPEETRVVVVRGNRIEEFDFESQDKKQLKGNIYLARVTRVEPSLQAAFVEYGGNRHGFLAFSEIHPDYYQIPVADRQALLRAEAEEAEEDHDDDDDNGEERQERNRGRRRRRGGRNRSQGGEDGSQASASDDDSGEDGNGDEDAAVHAQGNEDLPAEEGSDAAEGETDDVAPEEDGGPATMAAAAQADVVSEEIEPAQANDDAPSSDEDRGNIEEISSHHHDEHGIESVGAEDALEEVRRPRKTPRRHYKIQEVIKRRQILLVQVVKEERGNKGAALTTYLSLAGRYSVLMPNTARGGGISRKITNAQDRKRLKEVVQELEVPQGMGVILRTAGESRTKAEIKRDYEYLMRLWETVRSLTLESIAPALVYEEGSLIKRSVRDLYNKDIDEILVSGEDGYREAKDFMRMLMPSHAKVVQPYRESTPIFVRYGIEAQLDRMLQPQVTLKSGGYIIINQTEALVAIDVNSGRSTKEHSIEETALHTNLEAAEEVARHLRLRDLAGLIVIDFIDMEENRNNRAVEKKLKDCLKNDRARIQVGRISHFGLMEMSRQRIRSSVLESTMKPCPHCNGTGHLRSDSSVALLVVRAIEEFLLKDSRHHITVRTPVSTALYVLNHKRSTLIELEQRFGLTINMEPDETVGSQHYAISRGAVVEKPLVTAVAQIAPAYIEPEEPEDIIVEDEEAEEAQAAHADKAEDGEQRDRKRRKRRRRRGGKDREREHVASAQDEAATESVAGESSELESGDGEAAEAGAGEKADIAADSEGEETERKKRRRGKRGGKRNRKEDGDAAQAEDGAQDIAAEADGAAEPLDAVAEPSQDEPAPSPEEPAEAAPAPEQPAQPVSVEETAVAEKPKRAPRRTSKAKKAEAEAVAAEAEAAPVEAESEATEAPAEKKPAKPRASRRKPKEPAVEVAAAPVEPAAAPVEPATVQAQNNNADEPAVPEKAEELEVEAEPKPKKAGWWQRKSFF